MNNTTLDEYQAALKASLDGPQGMTDLISVAAVTGHAGDAMKHRNQLKAAMANPSDDQVAAKADEVAKLDEALGKANAAAEKAHAKVLAAQAALADAMREQSSLRINRRDAQKALTNPIVAAVAKTINGGN